MSVGALSASLAFGLKERNLIKCESAENVNPVFLKIITLQIIFGLKQVCALRVASTPKKRKNP